MKDDLNEVVHKQIPFLTDSCNILKGRMNRFQNDETTSQINQLRVDVKKLQDFEQYTQIEDVKKNIKDLIRYQSDYTQQFSLLNSHFKTLLKEKQDLKAELVY